MPEKQAELSTTPFPGWLLNNNDDRTQGSIFNEKSVSNGIRQNNKNWVCSGLARNIDFNLPVLLGVFVPQTGIDLWS